MQRCGPHRVQGPHHPVVSLAVRFATLTKSPRRCRWSGPRSRNPLSAREPRGRAPQPATSRRNATPSHTIRHVERQALEKLASRRRAYAYNATKIHQQNYTGFYSLTAMDASFLFFYSLPPISRISFRCTFFFWERRNGSRPLVSSP